MLRHVSLGVVLGCTGAFLLLNPGGGTPTATAQSQAQPAPLSQGAPAAAAAPGVILVDGVPTGVVSATSRASCPGDLNGDNLVNTLDLGIVLANFGANCNTNTCTSAANCAVHPNMIATCVANQCQYACNTGYADCNATLTDGCEVYIAGDVNNCGTCGHVCANITNGTPACSNGVCTVGSCSTGFSNCSGSCVNLLTDPGNCGFCGVACASVPNASTSCVNGACTIGACNAGYADCDNNSANGCEINLLTNISNCGFCGNACAAVPNASVSCVNGACAIGACNTGYANCDNNSANGCEINLLTSVSNCGACGNVCANIVNGTPACVNGSCTIASCNAGWANCDSVVANGCEINTSTDIGNCGACGHLCAVANGTAGCVNGTCTVASCNAGFKNCDNVYSNGCEINTATNVSNCGNCGVVCVLNAHVASVACSGGTCVITGCQAGWFNSNGIYSDGCETNAP